MRTGEISNIGAYTPGKKLNPVTTRKENRDAPVWDAKGIVHLTGEEIPEAQMDTERNQRYFSHVLTLEREYGTGYSDYSREPDGLTMFLDPAISTLIPPSRFDLRTRHLLDLPTGDIDWGIMLLSQLVRELHAIKTADHFDPALFLDLIQKRKDLVYRLTLDEKIILFQILASSEIRHEGIQILLDHIRVEKLKQIPQALRIARLGLSLSGDAKSQLQRSIEVRLTELSNPKIPFPQTSGEMLGTTSLGDKPNASLDEVVKEAAKTFHSKQVASSNEWKQKIQELSLSPGFWHELFLESLQSRYQSIPPLFLLHEFAPEERERIESLTRDYLLPSLDPVSRKAALDILEEERLLSEAGIFAGYPVRKLDASSISSLFEHLYHAGSKERMISLALNLPEDLGMPGLARLNLSPDYWSEAFDAYCRIRYPGMENLRFPYRYPGSLNRLIAAMNDLEYPEGESGSLRAQYKQVIDDSRRLAEAGLFEGASVLELTSDQLGNTLVRLHQAGKTAGLIALIQSEDSPLMRQALKKALDKGIDWQTVFEDHLRSAYPSLPPLLFQHRYPEELRHRVSVLNNQVVFQYGTEQDKKSSAQVLNLEQILMQAECFRRNFSPSLGSKDVTLLLQYLHARRPDFNRPFEAELTPEALQHPAYQITRFLETSLRVFELNPPTSSAVKHSILNEEWEVLNEEINRTLGGQGYGEITLQHPWRALFQKLFGNGLFVAFLIGFFHFIWGFSSSRMKDRLSLTRDPGMKIFSEILAKSRINRHLAAAIQDVFLPLLKDKSPSEEQWRAIKDLRSQLNERDRACFDVIVSVAYERPEWRNPPLGLRLLRLIPFLSPVLILLEARLSPEFQSWMGMNRRLFKLAKDSWKRTPQEIYDELFEVLSGYSSLREDFHSGPASLSGQSVMDQLRARMIDPSPVEFPLVKKTSQAPGGGASNRAGFRGMEFRELDTYRQGDSIDQIVWTRTSAEGHLLVKRYETTQLKPGVLILDLNALFNDETKDFFDSLACSLKAFDPRRVRGEKNLTLMDVAMILPSGGYKFLHSPQTSGFRIQELLPILEREIGEAARMAGLKPGDFSRNFYLKNQKRDERYSERLIALWGANRSDLTRNLLEQTFQGRFRFMNALLVGFSDKNREEIFQSLARYGTACYSWVGNRAVLLRKSVFLGENRKSLSVLESV